MMIGVVDENVMLILNSVLLTLYGSTLLFGIFRVIVAYLRNKYFLASFFSIVSSITALEVGIQTYQVIMLTTGNDISILIIIVINVYAMIVEAAAIFNISDFWGQTSEILTKQSTQQQLKDKTHWVRLSILLIWAVIFSAYIGFAYGTDQVTQGSFQYAIIILGCQGIGVVLVFGANVIQFIQGYSVYAAIKRFQEWVSSLSIHKVQFCFLYLTSSIINLLRVLFLIAITVTIEFAQDGTSQYAWILVYIYSFSNLPIVLIYFLGFSTKTEAVTQPSLLEQQRISSNSSRSRRQTELSASSKRSSEGI